MTEIHIDLETYSSINLLTSGLYKYVNSPDFEILMIAYAIDDGPVKIVDLAKGEEIPEELDLGLRNPNVLKIAHNASFERNSLLQYGYKTAISEWICTAVLSAYAGLPLSLEKVSNALELGDNSKLSTGKALIKFFCVPIKPTKVNGMRERNMWYDDLEKWEEFKTYCIGDVVAEMAICDALDEIDITDFERQNYILDQEINDRGILVDLTLAQFAVEIDELYTKMNRTKLKEITGLENPNSPLQLRNWIGNIIGEEITSLAKGEIPGLMEKAGPGPVTEALKLRLLLSKTSVKKYTAMINSAGYDERIRGLVQFYGAGRTGRWAGRLVQVQNLPRNYMKTLDEAREFVRTNDYDALLMIYENIADVLSQLIRTAFIAPVGKTFGVSDFSAIEARVIAWLAGEDWRIDIFKTHGKIYEASAAMMLGIKIEDVDSDQRQKGKVAELALGYQGGIGAMIAMGAERMGLSEKEMSKIVDDWREASPNIVNFWYELDKASLRCVSLKTTVKAANGRLIFRYEHDSMTIELPSGKKLYYRTPRIKETIIKYKKKDGTPGEFTKSSLQYKGMIQETNSYGWISTYGGKLAENIVQAVSRDILAYSLTQINELGFPIVMHIHDEVVAEVPEDSAEIALKLMEDCMSEEIPWAKGLPLKGDGYITKFYKKD